MYCNDCLGRIDQIDNSCKCRGPKPKDFTYEIPEALRDYNEEKLRGFAEKCGARDWFGVWLILVDRVLLRAVGLTSRDLPDQTYWDFYDSGCTPREMAIDVLENEMPGLRCF